MLQGLLEFGSLDMVVLTRGENGAVLVTHEGTITQDGINRNVIDTVGAGDAFTAAFLVGELRGDPHDQNLRNSCEVAAATCTHSGAIPETRVDYSINNGTPDSGGLT
jgi:fructokinase